MPLISALSEAPGRRLVGLRVETEDADPVGDEPVWLGERYVGHTSSGHYGHSVGYAMALAFLTEEALAAGTGLEVTVMGERRRAHVVALPFLPRTLGTSIA